VAAPVYAELLAFSGRTEAFVDSFFSETHIVVEWEMDQAIWRTAGRVSKLRGAQQEAARLRSALPPSRLSNRRSRLCAEAIAS
jgi:hypothetical protein